MKFIFDETKELIVLADEALPRGLVCEEVEQEEALEIIKLGEAMIKKCVDENAIGMACPQIGVNKKMFVWMNSPSTFQIVLNPQFVPLENKKTNVIEGCLSFPGKDFYLSRFKKIKAKFFTFDRKKLKFEKIISDLSNERSFIFQHETDHLSGITIKEKGTDISQSEEQDGQDKQ